MATYYGQGPYGQGPYGANGRTYTPTPSAMPVHLLGVGPWAANIQWRTLGMNALAEDLRRREDTQRWYTSQVVGAAKRSKEVQDQVTAEYKRRMARPYPTVSLNDPTYVGLDRPVMALPQPVNMSFTLRKGGPAEASIELDMRQDDAVAIEEMVTDLWWRRRDPNESRTELIGRFNADAVDVSGERGRIRMSATFVDYRTMLGERIVWSAKTFAAGTAVTAVLAGVFPTGTTINLGALNTTDLGTLKQALEVAAGSTVESAVNGLQNIAPPFDWAVEPGSDAAMTPTLRLWPGGKTRASGVVLTDIGTGYSPILSWRRRTNREDYANNVFFSGRAESWYTTFDTTALPEGPRDAYESNDSLCGLANVQAAADAALVRRSQRLAGWTVRLAPGFWRGRAHIDVGDVIRVAVRVGPGVVTGTHPVEDIEVSVDANGVEDVSLGLGLPRLGRDPRSRRSFHGKLLAHLRSLGRK